MSRTLRTTKKTIKKLPEGLHKKEHHRCKCSWCLKLRRKKIMDDFGKKDLTI